MQEMKAQGRQAQNRSSLLQGKGTAVESPQGERIAQLEAMAACSPQAGKLAQFAAMADASPVLAVQRRFADMIHHSPRMAAQRAADDRGLEQDSRGKRAVQMAMDGQQTKPDFLSPCLQAKSIESRSLRVFTSSARESGFAAGVDLNGYGGNVIQRLKVFTQGEDGDDHFRDQSAADDVGDGNWYIAKLGEEKVYVHLDDLGAFMGLYGDQSPDIELVSNESDANDDVSDEGYQQNGDDGEEIEGGDLLDADEAPDVSTHLHFTDCRNPEQRVKRKVDPAEIPEKENLASALTPEFLPGQITEVRFMAPKNPSDHFEVICIAMQPNSSVPIAIKFDFNREGYRMIYGADPDGNNGNRSQRGETKPPGQITVEDATKIFATTASTAGKYSEGTNECGTFARSFYSALMGTEAPD